MNSSQLNEKAVSMSPRLRARIAGGVYVFVFVFGIIGLTTGSAVANLIAGILYIAVTVLFFFIFKPVNKGISLLAAIVSLAGIALGIIFSLKLTAFRISPLVFFGIYCLLIGYLIFKSEYLPRFLGVLMAIGGLGWLTFASPQLADSLSPYNFAPGMIGEGALTLWLLIMGVDANKLAQKGFVTEVT
jgi:hypothetical protein